MGSYNSQYEEYYKNLKRKKDLGQTYYNRGKENNFIVNYISKRIIRDLAGATILLFLVVLCKVIVTPQTQSLYNYSKEVMNKNIEVSALYEKIKMFSITGLEEKVTNFIEESKSKITGKKTINQKISEEFISPVSGTITSSYGYRLDPIENKNKFHHGVDIAVEEGTDIKSVYNGKVKEVGEDSELGKYILIDHGEGVETKYGHLSSINVAKE